MNSIQYILKRRKLNQTSLAKKLCMERENVSKWVRRERTIPADHQETIEILLNVPKHFFVDESRKCKILSDEDINELDEFFLQQEFESSAEIPKVQYWLEREALIRSRQINIEYEIKVLKKLLEQDVRAVGDLEEPITDDDICNSWEANISFYKSFLEIRRLNRIKPDEWNCIMKAMMHLSMKDKYKSAEDDLVGDIYDAIVRYRKRKEVTDRELMQCFPEIWGQERSNIEDQ